MRRALLASLACGLALASGCGDNTSTNPDDGLPRDMAVPADLTGSSGDGGGDGAAPPDGMPDLAGDMVMISGPPPTVIPHQRWVDFCKAFTACGFWADTLSGCIAAEPRLGNLPFQPQSVLTCIHDAGSDCNAIKVCFNNNDQSVACTPDTWPAQCLKNTQGQQVIATSCFPDVDFKYTRDCSKLGLVCSVGTGQDNADCSFPGTCNPADKTEYCVSDFVTRCNGGRYEPVEDCRVYANEKCAVTNGVAACQGQGAACTAARCMGTTLIECIDGKEATFDCSKLGTGMTCVSPNNLAQCGRGTVCNSTHADTCVGSVLTYCDAGLISTVNCTLEGWKKCVPKDQNGGGFCSN